jgi:hypothetical protein
MAILKRGVTHGRSCGLVEFQCRPILHNAQLRTRVAASFDQVIFNGP